MTLSIDIQHNSIECQYAEWDYLNIMLNVVMRNVVMLSVIMLSVISLNVLSHCTQPHCSLHKGSFIFIKKIE